MRIDFRTDGDKPVGDFRKLAWESMLDADMNTRYWGKLARRYKQRETWIKIFLAAISSGSVAGWAFWTAFPPAWKALSALSALVALALPILDYPDKIESTADLHGKWNRLLSEYETIWSRMQGDEVTTEVLDSIRTLKETEGDMSRAEAKLPRIVHLVKKCQEEAKHSRGI